MELLLAILLDLKPWLLGNRLDLRDNRHVPILTSLIGVWWKNLDLRGCILFDCLAGLDFRLFDGNVEDFVFQDVIRDDFVELDVLDRLQLDVYEGHAVIGICRI